MEMRWNGVMACNYLGSFLYGCKWDYNTSLALLLLAHVFENECIKVPTALIMEKAT